MGRGRAAGGRRAGMLPPLLESFPFVSIYISHGKKLKTRFLTHFQLSMLNIPIEAI